HPLVTSTPKRGLATLAQASSHVPAAPGDQPEQDGLEAVPVRDPLAVTTKRMVAVTTLGQVGGECQPHRVDDVGIECEHGASAGSSGRDNSRIISARTQRLVDPSSWPAAVHPDSGSSRED